MNDRESEEKASGERKKWSFWGFVKGHAIGGMGERLRKTEKKRIMLEMAMNTAYLR